jgi:hypothetical protein
MKPLKLGMQVVANHLIDRWPLATILAGEVGEIVDITSDGVHVEFRHPRLACTEPSRVGRGLRISHRLASGVVG